MRIYKNSQAEYKYTFVNESNAENRKPNYGCVKRSRISAVLVTLGLSHNSNLKCQNNLKIHLVIVHSLKMCYTFFENDPTTLADPRIFSMKISKNRLFQ